MDNVYRDHEIYNFGLGLYSLSEYAVNFKLPCMVVSVEVKKKIKTLYAYIFNII